MNNVHMYQAHKDEPIRSISFAPTDVKLVTGSDDGTARIWDFARCAEERIFRGHGSDVRSVDWHPQKGLICTGSRDSQQPVKLWDPKTGQCLATLHDHKNSVMAVQWNKNGNWLLTGSRDHLIKMYDVRMMREMHSYRGHKKEVTALAWHPVHESLFVSGGGDGSMAYWLVNNEKELSFLEHAHDQAIWTLEWHPLGHILASGSNDNNTKFWARNRPGDTQDDIFGLSSSTGVPLHMMAKEAKDTDTDISAISIIPGMGLDDDIYEGMQKRELICASSTGPQQTSGSSTLAGPLLFPDDPNARQQAANIGAKKTLIKQPPPKKAQRQFERMWNVAKPAGGSGGGGDELEEEILEEGSFRRPKTSLLGPPPPSMLSSNNKSESTQEYSPPSTTKSSQSPLPSSSDSPQPHTTAAASSTQPPHIAQVGPSPPQIPLLNTQVVGMPTITGQSLSVPPPMISTTQWSQSPLSSSSSSSSQSPSAASTTTSTSATTAAAAATSNTTVIQQIDPPVSGSMNQFRPPPVIQQEMIPPSMSQTCQMSMGASQIQQIAQIPYPQQTVAAPLLWPPPIVGIPLPQNVDIDYRMATIVPPLLMPPQMMPQTSATVVAVAAAATATASGCSSGDVDLRNEQQPSSSAATSISQSWRTTNTSSQSQMSSSMEPSSSSSSSQGGGVQQQQQQQRSNILDPRMRHDSGITSQGKMQQQQQQQGSDEMSMERDKTRQTSSISMPIRDPRKRPQTAQSQQKQEGDYDARFGSPKQLKGIKRAWMPDMGLGEKVSFGNADETGSRSGPPIIHKPSPPQMVPPPPQMFSRDTNGSIGMNYSNYDERSSHSQIPPSYQQQQYSGGNPMRRIGPSMDRENTGGSGSSNSGGNNSNNSNSGGGGSGSGSGNAGANSNARNAGRGRARHGGY